MLENKLKLIFGQNLRKLDFKYPQDFFFFEAEKAFKKPISKTVLRCKNISQDWLKLLV
jgi:hypothetical protein